MDKLGQRACFHAVNLYGSMTLRQKESNPIPLSDYNVLSVEREFKMYIFLVSVIFSTFSTCEILGLSPWGGEGGGKVRNHSTETELELAI